LQNVHSSICKYKKELISKSNIAFIRPECLESEAADIFYNKRG